MAHSIWLHPMNNSISLAYTLLVLNFCFLLLTGCKTTEIPPLELTLQSHVDETRQSISAPEMIAVLSLPDGRTITRASGESDTVKHIQMHPADRLMSGSTGKAFAAGIIMEMIKEGTPKSESL